jgi:hypothetical protein
MCPAEKTVRTSSPCTLLPLIPALQNGLCGGQPFDQSAHEFQTCFQPSPCVRHAFAARTIQSRSWSAKARRSSSMSPRSAAQSGALLVDVSGFATNAAPGTRSVRCARLEPDTNGNHSTRDDDGRCHGRQAAIKSTGRFGPELTFVSIERLIRNGWKLGLSRSSRMLVWAPSKRPPWAGRARAETTCNARLRPGLWSCPPCRAVRRADTWPASLNEGGKSAHTPS